MRINFSRWEIILHSEKPCPTVGNQFPLVFPACVASRHPSIGILTPSLWRRREAASPMDGRLEARQAAKPTVEMMSHRRKWCPIAGSGSAPCKWFPTMRNHFQLVSPMFLILYFRPYPHFPEFLNHVFYQLNCGWG